jgi:Ca-activated chloride channel family protein
MAQTLTAPSGLTSTEGAAVPLMGVTAEARIRDYACRVVLTQRFRNEEEQPIEGVYKFPLAEGAAVCGFEVEIDGRRVVGRVEERDAAFETYDDAMAAGHGAYLLDEERADVFTASVGNLPPGGEAVLRITTVSDLPLEGDAIRFTLPTAIAPRYAPARDRKGVGESESERVSPPFALQVPYGLSLTVDVDTTAPVRSVESPTHPVKVSTEDGRATVTLSEREAALDRDVVLKISLAETHLPRALVERGPDGQAYALVSLRPDLEARPSPAEVVFLVDRSGSMHGTSMAEARNALQLALRSLRPGCTFNVVGFGSTHEALFERSRPYDEESLAEAARHVEGLEANLGGTEILPALEHVLEAKPAKGLSRQLFVLTDGQVSNTDAAIALARKHAGRTRVFTFGIGAGASHHLVEGLARAGEGVAEFIAPFERIEGQVLRQLTRALSPALTDVRLDWGGLDVEQAPHETPPVFAEGRLLVFARIAKMKPGTVTLRATGPDGELNSSLELDPAAAEDGSLVGTLWARHAIRDLEEGRSALHPRRGSRQRRARRVTEDQARARIVELGTTWSLVSRHTSFVAVEERETPTEGEARLRRVPVAITRGWHGMPPVGAGLGAPAPAGFPAVGMAKVAPVAMSLPPLADAQAPPALRASSPRASAEVRGPGPLESLMRRTPGRAAYAASRPLDRLVSLQRADGSWELSDALAAALGWKSAETLKKALGRDLADVTEERAAATTLALVWLEREARDSRDEWRLLAEKAREWLETEAGGADDWHERALAAWGDRG